MDRRDLMRMLALAGAGGGGGGGLVGDLYPETRSLVPDEHPFANARGRVYTTMLIEPARTYAVISGDLYMFPRSDGILLGGTHETGVATLSPDPAAKARILAGHRRLFATMESP